MRVCQLCHKSGDQRGGQFLPHNEQWNSGLLGYVTTSEENQRRVL